MGAKFVICKGTKKNPGPALEGSPFHINLDLWVTRQKRLGTAALSDKWVHCTPRFEPVTFPSVKLPHIRACQTVLQNLEDWMHFTGTKSQSCSSPQLLQVTCMQGQEVRKANGRKCWQRGTFDNEEKLKGGGNTVPSAVMPEEQLTTNEQTWRRKRKLSVSGKSDQVTRTFQI